NPAGDTIIRTDGSLTVTDTALIDSSTVKITTGGNIGAADLPLRLTTDEVDISAGQHAWLDLAGKDGDIAVRRLRAGQNLTAVSSVGLDPLGNATHISAVNLDLNLAGDLAGAGGESFLTAVTGVV